MLYWLKSFNIGIFDENSKVNTNAHVLQKCIYWYCFYVCLFFLFKAFHKKLRTLLNYND